MRAGCELPSLAKRGERRSKVKEAHGSRARVRANHADRSISPQSARSADCGARVHCQGWASAEAQASRNARGLVAVGQGVLAGHIPSLPIGLCHGRESACQHEHVRLGRRRVSVTVGANRTERGEDAQYKDGEKPSRRHERPVKKGGVALKKRDSANTEIDVVVVIRTVQAPLKPLLFTAWTPYLRRRPRSKRCRRRRRRRCWCRGKAVSLLLLLAPALRACQFPFSEGLWVYLSK